MGLVVATFRECGILGKLVHTVYQGTSGFVLRGRTQKEKTLFYLKFVDLFGFPNA